MKMVKMLEAMMPINWEIVDDYGLAIPDGLAAHRGHSYISVMANGNGIRFDKWHCGQCAEGTAEVRMLNNVRIESIDFIPGGLGTYEIVSRTEP